MTTGTLMFYGGMVIATVGFILLVVQLVSMRKKAPVSAKREDSAAPLNLELARNSEPVPVTGSRQERKIYEETVKL